MSELEYIRRVEEENDRLQHLLEEANQKIENSNAESAHLLEALDMVMNSMCNELISHMNEPKKHRKIQKQCAFLGKKLEERFHEQKKYVGPVFEGFNSFYELMSHSPTIAAIFKKYAGLTNFFTQCV